MLISNDVLMLLHFLAVNLAINLLATAIALIGVLVLVFLDLSWSWHRSYFRDL